MKLTFRQLLSVVITSLLILTISACGTTRKALDLQTTAQLQLSASPDVNPNSLGKPAPIVLQVIKLRDARQFKQEDFLNLYKDPQGRLGNDLIEIIKLKELAPGESRKESFDLTPEVKFLGVLGEYIQYEDANAKAVMAIEPHTGNDAKVSIQKLNIQIED